MNKTCSLFRPILFVGAALISGVMMVGTADAQSKPKKSSAATAQGFAGNYSVKGYNADGSQYSGTAKIGTDSNGQCNMSWTLDGSVFSGLCIDMEDILTVAYQVDGAVTVATYVKSDNGGIEGVWVAQGVDGMGAEELARR